MRRAATVVLASAWLLASCGNGDTETATETVTVVERPSSPPAPRQDLGEARTIELRPVTDAAAGDYGQVTVRRRQGPDTLTVEAFLSRPSGPGEAFEIWLYNSPDDLRSLGAQVSDESGDFAGRAKLPPDWRDYRYIDISREPVDDNGEHSGESVLRGGLGGDGSISDIDDTSSPGPGR